MDQRSIGFPQETIDKVKRLADSEYRTVSAMLRLLVEEALKARHEK